jgi:hypothetical protein
MKLPEESYIAVGYGKIENNMEAIFDLPGMDNLEAL